MQSIAVLVAESAADSRHFSGSLCVCGRTTLRPKIVIETRAGRTSAVTASSQMGSS